MQFVLDNVHFVDNHRVTPSVTDENGSDYINASYIDVGWASIVCALYHCTLLYYNLTTAPP